MKMKPKTKKIIAITSGSILVMALLVWYFFPVLAATWFLYQYDEFHQYLDSQPILISKLETPPKEWENITIDNLTMKLPLSEYTKVRDAKTLIFFISDKGCLLVNDIVPSKDMLSMIKENKLTYPVVSFQERVSIFSSKPADISFFNSRSRNMIAFANLGGKLIATSLYGFGKVMIINADNLKAICILSEKREKGYLATANVYSKDEKASLSLMFLSYKNARVLESDLLFVLGGIKMFDNMPDRDKVNKDIHDIVTKFNKA
jgi:hypothetical protein